MIAGELLSGGLSRHGVSCSCRYCAEPAPPKASNAETAAIIALLDALLAYPFAADTLTIAASKVADVALLVQLWCSTRTTVVEMLDCYSEILVTRRSDQRLLARVVVRTVPR